MTRESKAIAALLRERLPDIPLTETAEGGPWPEGIAVYRFTRTDQPGRTYPYKGTMVQVMYAPQTESEVRHAEWFAAVREVLLTEYGDRYRPLHLLPGAVLIQDAATRYSRERKAEYATRARLGFRPLHEMGK